MGILNPTKKKLKRPCMCVLLYVHLYTSVPLIEILIRQHYQQPYEHNRFIPYESWEEWAQRIQPNNWSWHFSRSSFRTPMTPYKDEQVTEDKEGSFCCLRITLTALHSSIICQKPAQGPMCLFPDSSLICNHLCGCCQMGHVVYHLTYIVLLVVRSSVFPQ